MNSSTKEVVRAAMTGAAIGAVDWFVLGRDSDWFLPVMVIAVWLIGWAGITFGFDAYARRKKP